MTLEDSKIRKRKNVGETKTGTGLGLLKKTNHCELKAQPTIEFTKINILTAVENR